MQQTIRKPDNEAVMEKAGIKAEPLILICGIKREKKRNEMAGAE